MLQEKAKMSLTLFIKKIEAFFGGEVFGRGSREGRRIYSYVFRDLNLTCYNTLLSYVPCIKIMYAHD